MPKQKIPKTGFWPVMTDTLPYETPLFFSNDKLYAALKRGTGSFPELAKKFLTHNASTRPYQYTVRKLGGSDRKLSVPHPAIQFRICEFYKNFNGFIENLCSRSSYSLRYPSRVGSSFYQTQFSLLTERFSKKTGADPDPTSFDLQNSVPSTHFHYRRYSQIYKFYASEEFNTLETNFANMLSLDISKCFESIYTHSISWAVRGKDFSKENIKKHSFEAIFDKLMQDGNWSETNGIIVGPEFSRIYAEIILQAIDEKIYRCLASESDFAIRRYVDDILVFSNSVEQLQRIKAAIERNLLDFNLHLNEKKTKLVSRPLMSTISIARDAVRKEIKGFFCSVKDVLLADSHTTFPAERLESETIRAIRKIAKEQQVDYSLIASPALSVVVKELGTICRATVPVTDPVKSANAIITKIIDISHFLFNMDVRVTTSHKIVKIYYECRELVARLRADRNAFEGQIIDSMRQLLARFESSPVSGPELSNVLIAIDALCENKDSLRPTDLQKHMKVDDGWEHAVARMDYFEIITAIYISRKRSAFREVSELCVAEIEKRILSVGRQAFSRSAETLLFFDYLSCPYIPMSRRVSTYSSFLSLVGAPVKSSTALDQVIRLSRQFGFTVWNGRKLFRQLLARKELQPAYD